MSVDPQTLESLTAAIAASPDDVPLRLHLATLLLQAGRASEAMEQCTAVLAGHPACDGALALAADAASALGDEARASAYRRLWRAVITSDAEPDGEPDADPGYGLGVPGQEAATPLSPSEDASSGTADVVRLRAVAGGGAVADDSGDVELPGVTLADVGGMDAVKARLRTAFLAPMTNPQLRQLYGKSLRGGLLLYGPPGCGKTFIARATAGELGARFFSVGLADVLDMWLGESEKNLHHVFETARRHAPCVLFLDEVDALGQKRSHLRHSAGRNIVVQLLSELDGIGQDNEGVFVLAATNHPWDVDAAFKRPGRFDRTLLVLPPDQDARSSIFAFHLRDRPVADVDLGWLAAHTEDYSGADLAHLCDTAAEHALQDSLATGQARPITPGDLQAALREVRSSTGAWFEIAKNYAMFANESGVYDDLLAHIRGRRQP